MALQSPCSGSSAHTWIEDVILEKDLKRESHDHVDEVDVHPLRVFLFLLLDTLEFAIIKKKHTYMTMVIFLVMILMIVLNMTLTTNDCSNDDRDDSSHDDNDDSSYDDDHDDPVDVDQALCEQGCASSYTLVQTFLQQRRSQHVQHVHP